VEPSNNSPAARRYLRRFIPLMLSYVAILLGVSAWFNHGGPTGWLRYLVAVLPAIPLIGVIAAMAAFIVEEKDEYQRMLMVRNCLYGIGFSLSVSTVWGFLQNYGLAPVYPGWAAFVLFCIGMIPGAIIEKLRS
jgi:hypothetical protein